MTEVETLQVRRNLSDRSNVGCSNRVDALRCGAARHSGKMCARNRRY